MAVTLERVLADASSCQVYDAGMAAGRPLAGQPVLTLRDPEILVRLRSLLRVREGPGFHCMCNGDATFCFADAAGQPVATVSLHHAASLRWSGWQWDQQLADGPALAEWLAAQGFPRPLAELRASQARAHENALVEQEWVQAVPGPARPLLAAMLGASRSGTVEPGLVQELDQVLARAWPGAVTRCQVLLAWYSAGTGRYSGWPVHESIPGMLLARLPITVVVQALEQDPADERVWRGAARHLSAWRARSPAELGSVPPQLRRKLLQVAQAQEEVQAQRLRQSWG